MTPKDEGAIPYLAGVLKDLGFACHIEEFAEPGTEPVVNLYARLGTAGRNLCFAGHTDVVPPGNAAAWSIAPFAGKIEGDRLHGRGATDMKGAIACFAAAAARFVAERGSFDGSISFLITGDEEGVVDQRHQEALGVGLGAGRDARRLHRRRADQCRSAGRHG